MAGMIAVCERDGYAGANVSAVIAEAGVSRPTFYEYFEDKDDCFLACIAESQRRLAEETAKAVQRAGPGEATRAALRALVEFASAEREMARFLMSEAMAGGPRALDARDGGLAELARIIEGADLTDSDLATPDVPTALLLGAVYRLLASRLRRRVPGVAGLLEDLLAWSECYGQPAEDQRWRGFDSDGLAEAPPPAPGQRLRAPMALGPGRPRLSEEEVAENHRQRLLFAAARLGAERGYTATTIAAISKRAGVDRRAFYALFKDKRDVYMAVHEFGFQRVLAVTAGAFFAGRSWPERLWEGGRGLTDFLEDNPTIAHVGFVEAYAVGPGAVRRVEDSAMAFTVFLREGYQYEPRQHTPSRLALEAIVTTIFELVYHQARARPRPNIRGVQPLLAFLCLAPFLGPAAANDFTDLLSEHVERPHPGAAGATQR